MNDVELTINILNIVSIKMIGDKKIIKNIKEYFPDFERNVCPDYTLEFKGIINQECFKLENNKVSSFKGTQYIVEKSYSISFNSQFSSEHIIYRKGKSFEIYSFGENYEMLFVRLCREIMFRTFLIKGYTPLHASAVLKGNKALVFTGESGNGKSTCFLFNTLIENGMPIANDILMYKKENTYINIIGIPFKVSVAEEFFDKYKINYKKNKDNKSKKIKYSIRDFCDTYDRKWCWQAEVRYIYILNYKYNFSNYKLVKIKEKEFLTIIENIYNEEVFNCGDFLNLGGDFYRNDRDLYRYTILLEGNVVEYFNKQNSDMHIHLRKALNDYNLLKVYLKKCLDKKLKKVLFLDHGDRISKRHKPYLYNEKTVKNYNDLINKIRKENSEIQVESGIEVDFSYDLEFQRKVMLDIYKYNFDIVIGSIHCMNSLTEQEYFKAVLEMVKIYPINIIGHIKLRENYINCENEIREIFNEIRENHKDIKIEINTSDRAVWDIEQLKFMMNLMKEYNIDYTVGSDAHSKDEIGYNIKNIIGKMRRIGW